jgi:hypothetical protein
MSLAAQFDEGSYSGNITSRKSADGDENFLFASRKVLNGERIEEKKQLSKKEYKRHLAHRDMGRMTLQTVRSCFHWKTHYYNLDTHANVPGQPTILRTYSETEDPELPPFVKLIKDVTESYEYSSHSLAEQAQMDLWLKSNY